MIIGIQTSSVASDNISECDLLYATEAMERPLEVLYAYKELVALRQTGSFQAVVTNAVLLLYVHGNQLWSCRDGQLIEIHYY